MARILVILVVFVLAGTGATYFYMAARATPTQPAAAGAKAAGICPKHQIEEARCPFCNRSLVLEGGDCAEHGVPEALCFRCRPELEAAFKAEGDWCAAHQVPESQCDLCNPDVLIKHGPSAVPAPNAEVSVEQVTPDELPRIQRAPAVTCAKDRTVIRLASAEVAQHIGLEVEPVRRQTLHQTLVVNAETAYDATQYARLSSRAAGVVVVVHKNVGDPVQAGEVLAVIDSADLGGAKAAVLAAAATVRLWERNNQREQGLLGQGIATEQEVLETETKLVESRIELARARQRLRNLGLADEQVEQVLSAEDTSSGLQLSAPFDGLVVERKAVVGEVVDTSAPLLAVADTSRLWAMLDLSQADIARVQVGQPVVLTIDGLRGETFAGRIASINSDVDPRTRTAKARAEIDNERGRDIHPQRCAGLAGAEGRRAVGRLLQRGLRTRVGYAVSSAQAAARRRGGRLLRGPGRAGWQRDRRHPG